MRVVFMGTPESAVPMLKRLSEDGHEVVAVWTQPDRPSGRGHKLTAPPVKEFALARGLAIHQPATIKTDESFSLFAAHDADIAVVVAYGRILPAAYLHAPLKGCVNVHFSLLPKYRGAAPVNWAIARGEAETGVTTMQMDTGLDTGAILLRRATAIGATETAPELMARLAPMGAELLSETLARFDEIEPRPQRDEDATYAPILRRADGRIDWAMNAFEIERRARGFQPWPNAFTEHKGQRLIIWNALGMQMGRSLGEPGEVVEASPTFFVVACGAQTALRVLEVQPEGRRRMSALDFLNGSHLRAGVMLG